MKAAKDREDDFNDSACKKNILERNQTRLELWEEHFRDPIIALDKALKCLENQYQGWLLARGISLSGGFSMACARDGSGMVPKMWKRPLWEGVCLYLDPRDSVRLRTASTHWSVPRMCGPHGELFFLLKKEPMVLSELVEFGPCIWAETVKSTCLDRSVDDG